MVEKEPENPAKDLEDVELVEGDPTKVTKVRGCLDPTLKDKIVEFLKKNLDIFTWTYKDIPGIDNKVIEHRLNFDPTKKLIQQKRRVFTPKRNKVVMEEVEKLLAANFIREVFYPKWLANVIMVKNSNGKWQMCIDFMNPNCACPKDSFPLPRIDQVMDSTASHELLAFMDAFSGYNQIRMNEEDQEKTTFVTSQGLYSYKVMSFSLKNARATHQRLVNHMFSKQIGRNMEVYMDDMLLKSKKAQLHLDDLKETFDTLRKYQMRLNQAKCVFGVLSGKFLGFLVFQRGIATNPKKVKAILDMTSPRNVKEV